MANAGKAASAVIPDEAGQTFPVPKWLNGKPVIQILFYPTFGSVKGRVVALPDHCMLLDAVSGKVLRFWACTHSEIGLSDGVSPVHGAGIRAGMSIDEHTVMRDRLMDISKPVWEAFFQRELTSDSSIRALVREYRLLFLQTTNGEVAEFTVAAAPEFFQWLDTTTE